MHFHEWSHTLRTGKSKEGILKLFYSKRNMVQCKILIQLFPSWKQDPPIVCTEVSTSPQGRSQDLNPPHQDIAQNFDDDYVIIMTLTSLLWHRGRNMKNFKYCAISLNMVHRVGLCGVLGFTSLLIFNLQKIPKFYTLNSALCAPIARAAIKLLLLGVWWT